jgi:hypothetical protein
MTLIQLRVVSLVVRLSSSTRTSMPTGKGELWFIMAYSKSSSSSASASTELVNFSSVPLDLDNFLTALTLQMLTLMLGGAPRSALLTRFES